MLLAREQRRLAAMLFADAVGSSRLMGRDESGTVARLLEHLNQRLALAATRRGGRVVRLKGDGSLIEFASAVDALAAAIDFQQTMIDVNHDEPEDKAIVFRVGLHLGDVIVDGDDIYGDAVNVAARLETEAPPGGIVVSRAVREAVTGRLKVSLHALGDLALKNIERPIRAFRVEWTAEDLAAHSLASGSAASPMKFAAALTPPDKPSIAVLPFQNMSGDPEQEYFAEGLTQDIASALSRMPWFVAIGHSLSNAYRSGPIDARIAAREFGASYVLTGSVRKAGTRLRIAAELVATATGTAVWTEWYDVTWHDIFELQDGITSSVASVVAPMVLKAEIARAQAKPTRNLTAYDLYLRAMSLVMKRTAESHGKALELLYEATGHDPNFASAFGLIAACHYNLLLLHGAAPEEQEAYALKAARRAIEIGQDNPEALSRAAVVIAIVGERPDEGRQHVERALALSPNLNLVARDAALICGLQGEHGLAIQRYEKVLRLNPSWLPNYDTFIGLCGICFFAGRFDESIEWADRALAEQPNSIPVSAVKAAAMSAANRPADEISEVSRAIPALPAEGFRRRLKGFRRSDVDSLIAALRKVDLIRD
jgi:class 3 adenylate cyclase/TolB-like protein